MWEAWALGGVWFLIYGRPRTQLVLKGLTMIMSTDCMPGAFPLRRTHTSLGRQVLGS